MEILNVKITVNHKAVFAYKLILHTLEIALIQYILCSLKLLVLSIKEMLHVKMNNDTLGTKV